MSPKSQIPIPVYACLVEFSLFADAVPRSIAPVSTRSLFVPCGDRSKQQREDKHAHHGFYAQTQHRLFVAIPGMVAAFEVILTLTRILASVRADPEACIDAWTSIRRSGTGLAKAQRKMWRGKNAIEDGEALLRTLSELAQAEKGLMIDQFS
jgi:hypothetical protein